MPIEQIKRLKGCGVFRDFSWPNNLPHFQRFNLIYGWNGCGKTTLSRLLQALENRTPPSLGEAVLVIDGRQVTNADFPGVSLPLKVFNRDYVNASVFSVSSNGQLAPIFVLGKDNVEKQKLVDNLKQKLTEHMSALETCRKLCKDCEANLDRFAVDQAKTIKELLRSSGENPFNNYNKATFLDRVNRMIKAGDRAECSLSDETIDKLLAQHRSSPKAKLSPLRYSLPSITSIASAIRATLAVSVVSSSIESLKGDTELATWLYTGLSHHRDRSASTCLFCDQSLPPSRLEALEKHFNKEYDALLAKLDQHAASVAEAASAGEKLLLPSVAEFQDDLRSEYDAARAFLLEQRDSAMGSLKMLGSAISEKRGRLFETMTLTCELSDPEEIATRKVAKLVSDHNSACDQFLNRTREARQRLEANAVAFALETYETKKTTLDAAIESRDKLESDIAFVMEQIQQIEREIVRHREPAEWLNSDIRNYLGHSELQLEVHETGYRITRSGIVAESLSEGETTAIALLYFLQSLNDHRFNLREGVVVLDDPVSSLDHNALFAAFGFIRSKTKDAAQVLILAHNFTFFRLVRDWFENLRGPDKNNRQTYMLRCVAVDQGRQSVLEPIDPLLLNYQSEYHYLFALLYKLAKEPQGRTLEQYLGVPSIARRVLEMFLAFKVPGARGQNPLWSQMQEFKDYPEDKRSKLYRFVQTHSHRQAIGDADEDLTLLSESRSVLNDLLLFMEEADPEHYSRMVALVVAANV